MSKRNMFVLMVMFLAFAVALFGCGQPAPAPDVEVDEVEEEVVEEEEETVVSESVDMEIVFIPKNTGNPYFDSIDNGFQAAAEELGFEYSTTAPATPEATSQIPFVKTQIQRGVDVIAIAPNSPDALNEVFQEAMDAGILVFIVNSDIPGSEDFRDVAILPMDFDITGESQVELMGSLIDYEGEIAILSATADAPDQNYWIEGMIEALEDEKYSGMELVEIAYGDDLPDKSMAEAEALLIKYPNLRGIISPTTVGVAAAAQAVENAGRAPELQVTGLGTPNQMRRFVENGTVTAFALWNPYDQGVLASYLAKLVLFEGFVIEPGASFDVPLLGRSIEIGPDNVIITGPPVVFDIDNIGDFDF
jgi:rhamnose transport system substrate-binding protein